MLEMITVQEVIVITDSTSTRCLIVPFDFPEVESNIPRLCATRFTGAVDAGLADLPGWLCEKCQGDDVGQEFLRCVLDNIHEELRRERFGTFNSQKDSFLNACERDEYKQITDDYSNLCCLLWLLWFMSLM